MSFNALKNLFASGATKPSVRSRPVRQFTARFEQLETRQMLSATVWVDNSAMNARVHPRDYTSISAAVAAARPGDTIKVAPGQYNESVSINKTLTIIGGQARLAGELGASVVKSDTTCFRLAADNVTVQGFTTAPASAALGAYGIATDPAHSGYKILDDIFADEWFALDLATTIGSATKPTTVSGNQFGANSTYSIHSAGLSNTTISGNKFAGQSNSADKFSLSNAASVQILNNQFDNTQGIQLQNTTNSKVDGNVITNCRGINAIDLNGGVNSTEIAFNTLGTGFTAVGTETATSNNDNNQISHNTIAGFSIGIALNQVRNTVVSANTISNCKYDGIHFGGGSFDAVTGNNVSGCGMSGVQLVDSSHMTVSSNVFSNNAGDGILLRRSNENTVTSNTVNGNQHFGIHLITSNNNTASGNTVNANATVGILVDADASGNTFIENSATSNGTWDLEDDTAGSGTAGTANIWTNNVANTRSLAGLG